MGVQATAPIALQPAGDRVAMDSEMGGRLVAARDLPRLEEHQQMPARSQVGITLTAQARARRPELQQWSVTVST